MIYLIIFFIFQQQVIAGESISERTFLTEKEIESSKEKRSETVLKCAQCHTQQYKEWIKGPHANAYKMWSHNLQNVKLERPFGYLTAELAHQQIVVSKDKCLNCHNPPNIMDLTYDYFKEKGGQLTSKQIYDFWENQKKVRDENSSTTSIDCLTCHVKNNQVLVKEQKGIEKFYGDYPHVVGDTTVGKAENNCILCHDESLDYKYPKNAKSGENSCLSCHATKENNKYSHYLYWRHGNGDGISSSKYFYGVFDLISISRKNKGMVKLNWALSKPPHSISICAAVVLIVDGLDANENVVWSKNINISRQDEFIKIYKWDIDKFAKDHPEQYNESHTIGPNSPDLTVQIPVEKNQIKSLRLKGYYQIRFWLELYTKKPMYEKVIKLK